MKSGTTISRIITSHPWVDSQEEVELGLDLLRQASKVIVIGAIEITIMAVMEE